MSNTQSQRPTLRAQLAVYGDFRIISVFIFGILSGLPWVMIGSALTLWLREVGVTRTEVGYAGLIYAVFAVNFLWSPLLDQVRIRLFSKVGLRRGWIYLCQSVILLACLVISQLSPADGAKLVVLVALVIAIASATQDIAIDAYRVDLFQASDAKFVSAGAAAATAGWWTGFSGLGYFPLVMSDMGWTWDSLYLVIGVSSVAICAITLFSPDPPERALQTHDALYRNNLRVFSRLPAHYKWLLSALIFSPLVLALWAVAGSYGLPEAIAGHALYVPALVAIVLGLIVGIIAGLSFIRGSSRASHDHHGPEQWLTKAPAFLTTSIIGPIEDFFRRHGTYLALLLLAFVLIFKLGEAFLGRMSIVFYNDIGYSNTDIATYSKMLTWWVTVGAAIPCGLLNARFGIIRGLFVSGIFMAASNLMFTWIALVGPDLNLYMAAVIVDGITAAWASVAFVAFISMLCSHGFSATQYAILASLASLGRTTLASFSGQVVDAMDGNWALFFVLTALMVIPGLTLLLMLKKRLTALYHLNDPPPKR